jgi:hypothetical protein
MTCDGACLSETLIKMADGTSKPIHKGQAVLSDLVTCTVRQCHAPAHKCWAGVLVGAVEPGDACAGGVVISTMKFAFDPAHDVLYDVDGIRVRLFYLKVVSTLSTTT